MTVSSPVERHAIGSNSHLLHAREDGLFLSVSSDTVSTTPIFER